MSDTHRIATYVTTQDTIWTLPSINVKYYNNTNNQEFYDESYFTLVPYLCQLTAMTMVYSCSIVSHCVSNAAARTSICSPQNSNSAVQIRGTFQQSNHTYVELRLQACQSGSSPVICAAASDISKIIQSGIISVEFASDVPNYAITDRGQKSKDLKSRMQFFFPLSTIIMSIPIFSIQIQEVEFQPSYFGSAYNFRYSRTETYTQTYGPVENGTYAAIRMSLDNQYQMTTFSPATLLSAISTVGTIMCLVWMGSYLVYKFNQMWFFIGVDDRYYVPNFATREIITANRRLDVKKYENQLIYIFTFGMTDRFGLNTQSFYEFFLNRFHRYHRHHSRQVVEDIQRLLMPKRIGEFVSEEAKRDRLVESNYSIQQINTKREDLAAKMRTLLQRKLIQDDETDENDTNELKRRSMNIREVEKSLRLTIIQDELLKLRTIIATLYPQQVKREKLMDKIHLKPENATFTTRPDSWVNK